MTQFSGKRIPKDRITDEQLVIVFSYCYVKP